MVVKGEVWKFGDDIDTDQIYPGKYLPLTDKKEMAKHAMEGVEGGEDFLRGVESGDILVAGKNFGCGSSREHAAIAIKGAGIQIVMAKSFARIFYRNCINMALPILEMQEIDEINQGDELNIDIKSGKIENLTTGKKYQAHPMTGLESEIMEAGGLLEYLKKHH
ncbi:MAG: 3-isopropylmalate dehydratase small subunit [Candidatus Edwardsbacteria bacterium]